LALDRFQLLYDFQSLNTERQSRPINLKGNLAQNSNLTPEQIDLLYQTEGVNENSLATYSKPTDEQFMRFVNIGKKNYLAQNPNLTPEQIDMLYDVGADKGSLSRFPKLTNEQFMRLFNDEDVRKKYLSQNPNYTTEQIDLLYQTEGVDKNQLARFPKLTNEQFMRFFNEGQNQKEKKLLFYLTQNPNLTPKQIDLLYDAGANKDFLARFPKLTDEQFMRAFNDKDVNKTYIAQNPNLTLEQIDLLYNAGVDKDQLARFPKLTDEQFMRAFNDGNKKSLALNPSINPPAKQPFASGVFNWRW